MGGEMKPRAVAGQLLAFLQLKNHQNLGGSQRNVSANELRRHR